MRGNPIPACAGEPFRRSIPACAGEPAPDSTTARQAGVYPRLCGGTQVTRGGAPLDLRSIPACAGEPTPHGPLRDCSWVYPRLCGGTCRGDNSGSTISGLSPPVRGNPDTPARSRGSPGSIPACAGEPRGSARKPYRVPVYPRLCGGTSRAPNLHPAVRGLSPPVRGNRGAVEPGDEGVGSIPACAGEPAPDSTTARQAGVYPRLCGGTAAHPSPGQAARGLSPPVRGNHAQPPPAAGATRSIPACAGEPCTTPAGCRGDKVYPRLCGGTRWSSGSSPPARGLSPPVRGNLLGRRHAPSG